MQQNKSETKTQVEVTTHSVFGIATSDNSLCFYNPKPLRLNNKATVSSLEFNKRLLNKIGEFIDDDFDWKNVLIGGGLISGFIDAKYDADEYQNSDVDMFVYGKNKTLVLNKIQAIYDYFVKKLDKKFYSFVYIPNTPIINIIIPGRCSFQIIGTISQTGLEVLKSFDMTHCQVGYDGTNVVYTPEFIEAIKSRITVITKRYIHAYRLVKAYHRGYSIANPEYCYIRNIFHEYTSKPGDKMPTNSDKFYDIHDLQNIMEILEKNKIVQQNLTKNYIPPMHDIYTEEILKIEMEKIGELYAGKGKFLFTNNCDNGLFIDDIRKHLNFIRMPFLC